MNLMMLERFKYLSDKDLKEEKKGKQRINLRKRINFDRPDTSQCSPVSVFFESRKCLKSSLVPYNLGRK
jgi:hypothetical protein